MNEYQFWAELRFASDSPKLHEVLTWFRNYVSTTPWYEMEPSLVAYFGCTEEHVKAWLAFARANFEGPPEKAKMLWAEAVAVTFGDGPWPGLFEQHRHDRSDL